MDARSSNTAAKGRGRPRSTPAPRGPTIRLRELRELRGYSQEELGKLVNLSQQQIGSLERGQRPLKFNDAQTIAGALRVSPSDFMPGQTSLSAPIEIVAASAFSESHPESFDLAAPHEWVRVMPRVNRPQDCFAAMVEDDHCDRIYPQGSILVIRHIDTLREPLKIGTKIVVRHYRNTRRDGDTMEVLVGVLDQPVTGDLCIVLRSNNRQAPSSVTIRPAPNDRRNGMSERTLALLPKPTEIDYRPADDDPAEILGVVVQAITPE